MSVINFTKPFYFSDSEQALAKSTMDALVHSKDIHLKPDGSLPETTKNFIELLNAIAEGRSITIISNHTDLTLAQAAEFLCVSEDFLLGLLESGEIKSKYSGTTQMVAIDSLLDYDKKTTTRQHEALEEMIHLSEEMGLYDD